MIDLIANLATVCRYCAKSLNKMSEYYDLTYVEVLWKVSGSGNPQTPRRTYLLDNDTGFDRLVV